MKKFTRSAIFFFMAQTSNKRVAELVTLLRRASAIAEQLEAAVPEALPTVPPAVAKMVADKISRRECLVCGEIAPPEDQYRRGLDQKHYQKAQRKFAKRPDVEAAMMANGHLGPRGVGGRAAEESVLDMYDGDSLPDASTSADQAAKDAAAVVKAKGKRTKKGE